MLNRYRQHKKEKGPAFDEMRRTNDGIYIADYGFKKQLWALDNELDVVWNAAIKRWEIWKFPGQANKKLKAFDEKAKFVMAVQTKNRTFRELGADILVKLQEYSFERFTVKQLCAYLDQQDENILRAKRKSFTNYLESVAKETAWYLKGLRLSVPAKLKPSDQKYLLKVEPNKSTGPIIFKPRTSLKLARSVREGV